MKITWWNTGIDVTADDYLQMSPYHESVIFSPTRPKDPKTPTLIFTAHDGTISEVLPQTPPRMTTTTSFTFPDTVAETATATDHDDHHHHHQLAEQSPTLLNNLDTGTLSKPRHKKNGMEPLPEEIPMLSSEDNVRIPLSNLTAHPHLLMDSNENNSQQQEGKGRSRLLAQQNLLNRKPGLNNVITPIPSPRHHIADTRLSNSMEDNNYVNTKVSTGQQYDGVNGGNVGGGNGNPKSVTVEAFSNPSYQILNKTVPTHHNHHHHHHNGN